MGYFSNTACIIIARGLEIFTISTEIGAVARAKHWVGCYQRSTQQGPYPADYSNVSMAKSCGCLSHSFVYVSIWGHG